MIQTYTKEYAQIWESCSNQMPEFQKLIRKKISSVGKRIWISF